MLKITARYTDEAELRRFIRAASEKYQIKCKPVMAKPVQPRPDTGYCKRSLLLDERHK